MAGDIIEEQANVVVIEEAISPVFITTPSQVIVRVPEANLLETEIREQVLIELDNPDIHVLAVGMQGPAGPAGAGGGGGSGSGTTVDTFAKVNEDAVSFTIGMPVYMSSASGVSRAKADAVGPASAVGLSMGTLSVGDTGFFVFSGVLSTTTVLWDSMTGQTGGLTVGARYYLSASQAGRLTPIPPDIAGQFLVVVGRALTPTDLQMEIEQPVYL